MANFEDSDFYHSLYDAKPTPEEKCPQSFADAVKDITPLPQEKVRLQQNKIGRKRHEKSYQRQQATTDTTTISDGLSTEAVDIVESDQALLFAAQGVQLKLLKRLQKGQLHWEQGIDLHGLSIDEARDQLSEFIRSSYYQKCQVVLVVHGKAYSQNGSQPLLKSYSNDWLRQLPQVLAFSSAVAKDGGTGALYVLLKRHK